MYGLLHSANRRLAHLPAAAPYSERLLRAFSSTTGVGDLVYVGKGYKICGKDEIESEIRRNRKIIYQTKKRNKILSNGRKELPPELRSSNVVRLTCDSSAAGGICDVYLVGSVHNRQESWREVENVMSFLKPEVVFLELCSRRLAILKGQQPKVPTMREMFELWKNNEDPFRILYTWFYAKCFNQQKRSEYDEVDGGEFRVAYKEAMKYGGKVILGDRPMHITARRKYAALSPWVSLYNPECWLMEENFWKMSVTIPEDLLKTAKDEIEYVKLLAVEVRKKLSTYTEVLIRERDRYMSAKILEVAREHNSVVAVVGRAHLAGIQEYWKQPVDMKEIQEILNIPAGNKIATMGKLLNTFGAMVGGPKALVINTREKVQIPPRYSWKNKITPNLCLGAKRTLNG